MVQEADISVTNMAFYEGRGPKPGDDRMWVKFYMNPIPDEAASKQEGRPIFKEVEWVDIRAPGNRSSVVSRKVRRSDIERFPNQYANFKKGEEEQNDGTPLKVWPAVTRAQVEELKFYGITTVEHLAGMSDQNCNQHMGLVNLRNRARLFLEAAKETAPLEKLHAELEARDNRIESLENQLQELISRINGENDEEDDE